MSPSSGSPTTAADDTAARRLARSGRIEALSKGRRIGVPVRTAGPHREIEPPPLLAELGGNRAQGGRRSALRCGGPRFPDVLSNPLPIRPPSEGGSVDGASGPPERPPALPLTAYTRDTTRRRMRLIRMVSNANGPRPLGRAGRPCGRRFRRPLALVSAISWNSVVPAELFRRSSANFCDELQVRVVLTPERAVAVADEVGPEWLAQETLRLPRQGWCMCKC